MDFLDANGVPELLWQDANFQAASPGGIMRMQLRQGAKLPATTFRLIGGRQSPTFTTSGWQSRRVEFDFHAADDVGAAQIRAAVIAVLNGFSGPLPNGFVIQNCDLIPGEDNFDDDTRQYRFAEEFYFYFVLQP